MVFLTQRILAFGLLFAALGSEAQPPVEALTLEAALQQALARNAQIRLSGQEVTVAYNRYRQTDALYLPGASLTYSVLHTNNPLHAFGFRLQQGDIKQQDFDPRQLNDPTPRSDFMTKLEVYQPLVNAEGREQRKAAFKVVEAKEFQTQRTREEVTLAVQEAWLQLQLLYRSRTVWEEALATAQAIRRFTSDRHDQGLLQRSDLLNAEVQVAGMQTGLQATDTRIANLSSYLSFLMGSESQVRYRPEGSWQGAVVDSLSFRRADFLALGKAIEATGHLIRSGEKGYIPQVQVFGSWQVNDNGFAGFGANAHLLGLQARWNLFAGHSARNATRTRQAEKQQLEQQLDLARSGARLALQQALREREQARNAVRQHETAVQAGSEALRILRNRYEQGLVNTTDVLGVQTRLAQQQLELAQARYEVQAAEARIQFITATTK